MDWLRSVLESRAFWTALLGATPIVCRWLGLTDQVTTEVMTLIGLAAGYWGVTLMRSMRSQPTSHTAVMAVLEEQRHTIDVLLRARSQNGHHS